MTSAGTPLLEDGVYILLYHHVGEETGWVQGQGVTTPVDVFLSHLDFLFKEFEMVPLKEAVDILSRPPVQGVYVSITFDDAFKSFFQTVYPEIRRRRIPVAVFVCTEFAEGRKLGWRNRLAYLCSTGHGSRVCEEIRKSYPPNFSPLDQITPETVMKWTKNHYRPGSVETAVDAVYDSVYGNLSVPLYMNWDEVVEVSGNPLIEIGNHSHSHKRLSVLSDHQAQEEISGAQRVLEQKLGRPAPYLAYPYGGPQHYTERDRNIVLRENLIAFSAHGGFNTRLDPTDVKRIPLTNQKPDEMLRKMSGNGVLTR